MSMPRRSSVSATRRSFQPPQAAPVKKSKTVLVVVIIIVVLVVLVTIGLLVYFLWWKKRTPATPKTVTSTKCTLDADCPTNKVCNTASGLCVGCLTDGNCSGATPVCDTASKTCKECLADTDCSGLTPLCNPTSKTCVTCVADTDCSGLTPFCDSGDGTCKVCVDNSSCTAPETCQSYGCCDSSPPTAFASNLTVETGDDECILVLFAEFSQSPASLSAVVKLHNANGDLLDTTLPFTPVNGVNNVSSNTFLGGTLIFPAYAYKLSMTISGTCSANPWSASTAIITMIPRAIYACTWPGYTITKYASYTTRTIQFDIAGVLPTPNAGLGFTLKLGTATPTDFNDFDYIFREVPPVNIPFGQRFTITIPAGPSLFGVVFTLRWWRDHINDPQNPPQGCFSDVQTLADAFIA